ncbi:hypothetical protein KC901_00305 [Patescibacteria group bacterium]|nr:hypothetical protein [Patescibacteria group bacterium]
MNYWREIRKKNWIDWIKIIVAIDVAGVGIGLILDFNLHVFAYMFGFITRIAFGVLYVFVAVLIFKRVFPQKLAKEENEEAERMDKDITETTNVVKKAFRRVVAKTNELTEKTNDTIDAVIDRGEEFIGKRKAEAKEEVQKLINE